MPWSHFADWEILGKLLYLKASGHRMLICRQDQVSSEDFAQFKALAAAHIPAHK